MRTAHRLAWHHASALGLLLGLALGLPAFLHLESAWWGLAWLAVFVALGWAGYRAEPVLEQKPALPTEPRRLRDGPFDMVELPGGTFLMGSAQDDGQAQDDEFPRHEVRVSRFRIAATPVTVGQYRKIMNGEAEGDKRLPASVGQYRLIMGGKAKGDNRLPVTRVTWEQAVEFCNRLSNDQGYRPCYRKRWGRWYCNWRADGYRLPTEAEWEYACRAGSGSAYCFGDDPADLGRYAWFADNSGRQPQPVGKLRPNRWGLYDMHGNVWEWCWDRYGTYPRDASRPIVDPRGPVLGRRRVLRGGSFGFSPEYLRSAARAGGDPEARRQYHGFRCVRVPPRH